jgi:hypothetical protein
MAAWTSTRLFPGAHGGHFRVTKCVIDAPLKRLNELSSMLHSHASDNSAVDERRPLRRPARQEGCRTAISPLNGRAKSLVLSLGWDRVIKKVRPALRPQRRSGLVTTKV